MAPGVCSLAGTCSILRPEKPTDAVRGDRQWRVRLHVMRSPGRRDGHDSEPRHALRGVPTISSDLAKPPVPAVIGTVAELALLATLAAALEVLRLSPPEGAAAPMERSGSRTPGAVLGSLAQMAERPPQLAAGQWHLTAE